MLAEQNVLGAVLIDPESYYRVSDLLTPDDFSDALHAAIWRAIGRLADAERPIDYFTVGDEVGGDQGYIVDLASNTPSSRAIRDYAERVKADSTSRRLEVIGHRIAQNRDLGEAQSLLSGLLDNQPGRLISAKDAGRAMFQGVMARYEAGDEYAGLLTKIPKLDELTGGLQKKRVYALGARAKMGKSILAWQIAANVALQGHKVAGFSLEMPTDELMQRMACGVGNVRGVSLLRPKLMSEDEWGRLNVAVKALSNAPLVLSDRMNITVDQIEAQVRQAKPALVVIDYLQLIEQPKLETEATRLAYITRRIKKLAKEADCPVIEVFQVNRGNEQGVIRAPRPSDARGSGTIEQDCDAMLLLHRPSYYDKAKPRGLSVELALQRNGPTGAFWMDDDLEHCRFLPSDARYDEPEGYDNGL